MDLELAGRTGLGAYDGSLGLVAEAPCHALDGQGDVLDVCSGARGHSQHMSPTSSRVNRSRTLCRLIAAQAHARLV